LRESTVDYKLAAETLSKNLFDSKKLLNLLDFLLSENSRGISGKIISSEWDNWKEWPKHLSELQSTDLYTLRRVTARDRNLNWGDI
jgi:hypothetical protein